jgi:hypothetical protein
MAERKKYRAEINGEIRKKIVKFRVLEDTRKNYSRYPENE